MNALVISAIEVAFATESIELTVKSTESNESSGLTEIEINALIDKENLKYSRIREAYENGIYNLDELSEAKKQTDDNIKQLKKLLKPEKSTEQIKKQFIHDKQDIISLLKTDNISEGEKNQILRSFIDKIVFNRSDCTVRILYFI